MHYIGTRVPFGMLPQPIKAQPRTGHRHGAAVETIQHGGPVALNKQGIDVTGCKRGIGYADDPLALDRGSQCSFQELTVQKVNYLHRSVGLAGPQTVCIALTWNKHTDVVGGDLF